MERKIPKTQCIVLGKTTKSKKLRPIEVHFTLNTKGKWVKIREDIRTSFPSTYSYIELISKRYGRNWDLMFVYNFSDARSSGRLCIGKWNDGVVDDSKHYPVHQ